jgi:hypothetical protein
MSASAWEGSGKVARIRESSRKRRALVSMLGNIVVVMGIVVKQEESWSGCSMGVAELRKERSGRLDRSCQADLSSSEVSTPKTESTRP